jgi:hypothetical protein
MKRIVLGTLLLSMLNVAGIAAAASGSATMEVSFVVKESCTVQLQEGTARVAPTVSCGHHAPYQVSNQVDTPAPAPSQSQADGQTWQITF